MTNQIDGSQQDNGGKQGKKGVLANPPRDETESKDSGGVRPVRIERADAEKNIPPDPDPDDPVSE